jgi:Flp pilus assembly protein TadG
MKRIFPSERGQAIIVIALAVVALIALTALAVDGGNVYAERRRAQNAADTTALDSALAKVRGQNLYTEGLARAASNHYVDSDPTSGQSTPDVNVEIYNPPISGAYAGNAEYIQAIITARVSTYFGRVIGITQVTNKVEAVARAKPPIFSPMFFGNAIVGLSPDDCKAIVYQGNANTTVTGGGIYVNSNCNGGGNQAAFFNNSSSAQLTAPCLQAVGGIQYEPGAINIPAGCIITGAPPLPAPIYPNPVCSGNAEKNGNTLSPGNYSGTFPPSGVTQLQSGIYCITSGNFRLNAGDELNGSGVVIRVDNGDVRWNGGATINLSAPTTGPFAGLLLYLPEGNDNEVVINGNSSSTFTGTILAPSASVAIDGTGGVTGLNSQVIGYTVNLTGTTNTFINYNAGQNYQAPENPAVQLVQ